MMMEFANECFIACYSQSQNVATMKYSVVQVKDKLLEAWFMKYLPIVCGLNNLYFSIISAARNGNKERDRLEACSQSMFQILTCQS